MRVLRPLSQPLFEEFKSPGDVLLVEGNELLTISPFPSAEGCCGKNGKRAFLGANTRLATTLAIVRDEDMISSYQNFIQSPIARYWWGEECESSAADLLTKLSEVLQRFPVGEVLRLEYDESRGLYLQGAYGEDEEESYREESPDSVWQE
ncbi:MAG: hypothetical protein SFY68_00070 [Candidatus Sumerlaeia bacterium]|nr:hypothetical protein [Candidatus Sumerlaeia bacterium]